MKTNFPRMTGPTLKVLAELLEHSLDDISGADIARTSGLASGTLYPILLRLESAKWVVSRWEEVDPSEMKRPRRRLYKLTGLGERSAKAAFREIAPGWGMVAWSS